MGNPPETPEWVEEAEDRETVYWKAKIEAYRLAMDAWSGVVASYIGRRAAGSARYDEARQKVLVLGAFVMGVLLGGSMGLVIGAGVP